MTHVKYKCNDVVYQYGSSVEDSGVYFIMSGEFEMSTYRLIETLPDYEEMKFKEKVDHLQSSAKIPMHRATQKNNKNKHFPSGLNSIEGKKKIPLFILGQFEHFGLQDIADLKTKRTQEIRCTSRDAEVYFWKSDNLIHQVN